MPYKQILLVLLVGVVFYLPLFGILIYVNLKRNRYKDAWREPFTDLPLRPAGESLRLRIDDLNDKISETLFWLGFVSFSGGLLLISTPEKLRIPFGVFLGVLVLLFYLWKGSKVIQYFRNLWNCRLGFSGERAVGEKLSELIEFGFKIFHDVPFKGFNIDHVLVGPPGVFSVETKTKSKSCNPSLQGKARYDGKELVFPDKTTAGYYFLNQTRSNAVTLSKWLTEILDEKIAVQPVLTLPGWYIERSGASELIVLNSNEFVQYMTSRSPILNDDQIERIVYKLKEHCRISA